MIRCRGASCLVASRRKTTYLAFRAGHGSLARRPTFQAVGYFAFCTRKSKTSWSVYPLSNTVLIYSGLELLQDFRTLLLRPWVESNHRSSHFYLPPCSVVRLSWAYVYMVLRKVAVRATEHLRAMPTTNNFKKYIDFFVFVPTFAGGRIPSRACE